MTYCEQCGFWDCECKKQEEDEEKQEEEIKHYSTLREILFYLLLGIMFTIMWLMLK